MNFKSLCRKQAQAAAYTRIMIAFVSGLVSRGGGEDAIQEWYTPQEWNLWDAKQHNSEQQLCTGQREVWYTLTNRSPRVVENLLCFHSIFTLCVLALEQPGWQLHRGAEFRDSGQSKPNPQTQPQPQPRPHLYHAGVWRWVWRWGDPAHHRHLQSLVPLWR